MRRYKSIFTAIVAVSCWSTAYAQTAAPQLEAASRPVLRGQDADTLLKLNSGDTEAEQWDVAFDDVPEVGRKLPYSLKAEWLLDLKQVCPECMTPEYGPRNEASVKLQPPTYAVVVDGAGTAAECVLYKALIATLRDAKAKDALLIATFRREIAQLQAKIETLEAQ